MGDFIFEAKGHNGTVRLYADRVVLAHGGVMGFLTTGASGERSIPIDAITSVDFKESSFLTGFGYLRPIYAGVNIHHNTWNNMGAATDENAVTFRGSQQGDFTKIRQLIEKQMQAVRTRKDQPAGSVADELLKFADLLKQGLLTQEEFDAKKKQILGP